MESLSRPPHRRKHSRPANASSSSFSLKNPYDDIFLSTGGKSKFQPHEYAEIFSGSSSIPLLDLSGLNEPPRTCGFRSSELDYSNIFGGANGDDVALPYEQLFNGGVKKTKTRWVFVCALLIFLLFFFNYWVYAFWLEVLSFITYLFFNFYKYVG